MRAWWLIVIAVACGWCLGGDRDPMPEWIDALPPLDPAAIPWPDGEPADPALIALGRRLFVDPRLSRDGTMSCATCHDPAKGLADGSAFHPGRDGRPLDRHTPAIHNLAWATTFFWDGRADSLEAQAVGPLTNPREMAADADHVARVLSESYRDALPAGGTLTEAARAIAAFERTLVSHGSAWDRFRAGDAAALPPAARRGLNLFGGKAACIQCHDGPNFTDGSFHHIGRATSDPGRGAVMAGASLSSAMKTPTLRNVERTAPYFHDGGVATLAEVIAYYNRGGDGAPGQDPLLRPLHLSAEERSDLLAFLHALTADVVIDP
jgi:cytochrome c peroxidase